MTSIVVVDTETTGFNPEDDRIVEIAAVRLSWDGVKYVTGECRTCLVDPCRDIPVVSSAVHHLTNADVEGARKIDEAIEYAGIRKDDVIVAHNATFDGSFLPQFAENPWVCTWKCAQKLIPDAPSYGNQVLRYYLGLQIEAGNGRAGMPHSAGYDARTTAGILEFLLSKASVEEMIEISASPVLLKKMPFGKHRGMEFSKVPADYRRWLRGQPDLDRDLKHTLDHYA